jgi:MoaA/NifB/PqqE/SkfB family radical SAM enzyme
MIQAIRPVNENVIQKKKLTVSWYMTDVCNFDCFYCYGHTKGEKINCVSADKVIDCLRAANRKDCLVVLVGGEVLLVPDIVNICEKLTNADFKISLETNLSLRKQVAAFADRINPGKVDRISISSHLIEREKRGLKEAFINDVLLLKDKGFALSVNYVIHPLLLSRFRDDYEFFKKKDITLIPRPFVGLFEDRLYPDAYSSEERALISGANPNAGKLGPLKAKGMLCNAGRNFILIGKDGTITRCYGDQTQLGNVYEGITLFEGPEPCPIEVCPCWGGLFLENTKKSNKLARSFQDSPSGKHKGENESEPFYLKTGRWVKDQMRELVKSFSPGKRG